MPYPYEGKKKIPVDPQSLQSVEDVYFDLDDIASATECTGLIPTPPVSEAEAEAYTELSPIPKPENDQPNQLQSEKKRKHK